MRIHYLQHARFETPGMIKDWGLKRGHRLTSTMLFENQQLPPLSDIDLLVIMGGPMNVYEEDKFGFLVPEKKFIGNAVENKKKVIGICLGAQLLACVLGASVKRNKYREIGWHNIRFADGIGDLEAMKVFPENLMTLHWHGDTFEIPSGAIKMASSEACENQGFIYDDNIFAFQFHPEVRPDDINAFIENDRHELVREKYVQTSGEIKSKYYYSESMNKCLEEFLEKI